MVDRWYGSSVRLARLLGADDVTAHRAAQDGWLGVITGLPELDGDEPLHLAVLRSTIENLAARLSAGDVGPGVGADSFEEEGHRWAGWWRDESTPKEWEGSPADEALASALGELDPAAAAVVLLHDVERLDAKEVEHVIGLAPADQRRLLHCGRLAIAKAITSERSAAA